MSKQTLDAFRTKLSQDPQLREELSRAVSGPAGSPGATASDLAAFAAKHGFEVTAAELAKHAELGDAELDQVAGGVTDYFLKMDGIKGEARRLGHKEWIDILSYGW